MPKRLPLVYHPDPRLRMVSEPIKHFNEPLAELIQDMFYTMRYHQGVGLAGVQVGVMKRIFVMHVDEPLCFINPTLTFPSDDALESDIEGCLSFPNVSTHVARHQSVHIHAYNEKGEPFEMTLHNKLAVRCASHENDHLNGIEFIDYAPKIKRKMLLMKLKVLKGI